MKNLLYWLPRILAMIYIAFFIFVALGVFSITNSVPFFYLFVAFLIHLLPSIILIACLFIAWHFEKVGGILFILFGVALAVIFQNLLLTNVLFFVFPLGIGLLFLFHYSQTHLL